MWPSLEVHTRVSDPEDWGLNPDCIKHINLPSLLYLHFNVASVQWHLLDCLCWYWLYYRQCNRCISPTFDINITRQWSRGIWLLSHRAYHRVSLALVSLGGLSTWRRLLKLVKISQKQHGIFMPSTRKYGVSRCVCLSFVWTIITRYKINKLVILKSQNS